MKTRPINVRMVPSKDTTPIRVLQRLYLLVQAEVKAKDQRP